MSLNPNPTYLDDWKDLIEHQKEIHEEVEKEKDQRDVTKDYIAGEIDEYQEEDIKREAAEIKRLDERIDALDPSAGPSGTYATKEELRAVANELGEEISQKADKEEIPVVPTKVSAFENDANYLTEHQDISGLATKDELSAGLLQKADASTVYTKSEADAKFLTEHQDLSAYAKTEFVNSEIERVESEIPSVENLATKEELADVEAKIPSVEGLVTEQQLTEAVADKATLSQVAEVDQKVDTKANSADVYTKTEVSAADTSVLNNILGRIWSTKDADPTKGQFNTKLVNKDGNLAQIFNESDGGGVIFEDKERKLKTFVGVNDGKDSSTGIHAQIYSKNTSTNEGARLNINPSGMYYGVGSSTPIDADHELAVRGDINEAVSKKANADEVVSKSEYASLLAKTEYLEQLIREYLPGAADEIIADGEISELSPEKKSVNILTPMKSIVVPEATTTYTIQAPLLDNSTVELTSGKSVTIYNTSDDAVSTAITGPVTESTTNPSVTLSGEFNTLTLENVSVSSPLSSTGKSPAAVKDVIITENNTKPVSINADFQDGATITNNSACNVSISNRNAVESSMTIVAPNSTVTLSSGQFNTVESTVGDNTLIVKNSVHINKLIVTKGNVVVDTYSVEECIDEVVNETEYTVTPVVVEVSTKSEWSKIQSKSALFVVQNDIMDANVAATGLFGGMKAKIDLNGHTVKCISAADNSYNLLARGKNLYIFENGTFECENGYGLWTSGETVMELHNVHVKVGGAHALYIEKSGGQFITSGNCRFEVTGDDKTFVVNYLDKTWNEGWRGFHFGEGTEFVDFNPAASMSEPGGPVNLLDAGYHTESHQEGEHTIWTVVKDA